MQGSPVQKLRSQDVVALLKARYPAPAHAFLEQVADGTGHNQSRWADAVAMSCWPSRGYELDGFEVKVSRSDWLAELRNPEKADAVMQYCNRWWLVVADPAIVQPGELPPTWGLMSAKGGRIGVIQAAPALQPTAFDVGFVASVLRNAAVSDATAMRKEYERGYREGSEHGGRNTQKRYDELGKSVAEFETASGLRIRSWDGPEIGAAVKMLRNMKHTTESLINAQKEAQRIANALEEIQGLPAMIELASQIREVAKQ